MARQSWENLKVVFLFVLEDSLSFQTVQANSVKCAWNLKLRMYQSGEKP